MTEEEWLSNDPNKLLRLGHPQFTARKLRLFAVACFRKMQSRFTDPRSWAAVEATEAFLEGTLSLTDLQPIADGAAAAWDDFANMRVKGPITAGGRETALAALKLIRPVASGFIDSVGSREYLTNAISNVRGSLKGAKEVQAMLFRDIFQKPNVKVKVDPEWRTADALLLARGIYEERAFDRMPILADALQDAGCTSEAILDHLRDPEATHVRGCWALDLVLDKT